MKRASTRYDPQPEIRPYRPRPEDGQLSTMCFPHYLLAHERRDGIAPVAIELSRKAGRGIVVATCEGQCEPTAYVVRSLFPEARPAALVWLPIVCADDFFAGHEAQERAGDHTEGFYHTLSLPGPRWFFVRWDNATPLRK